VQLTVLQILAVLGAGMAAYLCGSIPFGLLLGKLRGIDVRRHGSGNIGATNVGRVLGRGWGVLAFLLDLAKGFLPVVGFGFIAGRWAEQGSLGRAGINLMWVAIAAACILGHLFPVYLRFRGGKGVATSLGVLLGIYPYYTLPGVIAFGLWAVLTLATRYVSVGSVGAAGAFPILFGLFAVYHRQTWGTGGELWPFHAFAVIMALLVIYRHRGNLQRLYRGVEHRIGTSSGAEH